MLQSTTPSLINSLTIRLADVTVSIKSAVLMLISAGIICLVLPSAVSAVSPSRGDGILISNNSLYPTISSYDTHTSSFGSSSNISGGIGGPKIVQFKVSPTKNEAILGYENSSGNLTIMCYDGSSWSSEWNSVVGGSGTTRRFDIAYETSTGDVVIAYATNTTGTNALQYRIKQGSTSCGSANWSSATNFPTTTAVTTGAVQWVKAARDGRGTSALDAFIWADSNSDLGATMWNGSSFTNFKQLETSLEVVSGAQDIDDFEVQFESVSGDVMSVWSNSISKNNTQTAYYSTCDGGTATCTWSTPAKISTGTGDDATNLDLSANPNSDQMSFASISNATSDMQAAYWSGTAWTFYPNLDTTTEAPFAGSRLIQTGWVTNGSNVRWIITYDDSSGTGLSWYAATPGSTPTTQTDFVTSPTINNVRERYQVDMNPYDSSELMLLLTDSTKTVVAERLTISSSGVLTWTDASAPTGLGTTNVIPSEGFSFQYRRFVPLILSTDLVDSVGNSIVSPTITMSPLATVFNCSSSTATLGTSSQLLRIQNTTTNSLWGLSTAATGGSTALWSNGTAKYDFNDPGGSPAGCSAGLDSDTYAGQLSLGFSGASITAQSGCSTTGLSFGSSSGFDEGVANTISILSAGATAGNNCYWDIMGINLTQQVPAEVPPGNYTLGLTLTAVAN